MANLGLLIYFYRELQPSSEINWILAFGLVIFFFGFGLVIALYKDIPDLSGDREYDIRTYSVRLGPERVFKTGRWILTAFYLVPILASASRLPELSGVFLLATHVIIVGLFWRRSLSVNVTNPEEVTSFYMFLWSLFYIAYVLLAMAALAG